jgi:hypothetical protein
VVPRLARPQGGSNAPASLDRDAPRRSFTALNPAPAWYKVEGRARPDQFSQEAFA